MARLRGRSSQPARGMMFPLCVVCSPDWTKRAKRSGLARMDSRFVVGREAAVNLLSPSGAINCRLIFDRTF